MIFKIKQALFEKTDSVCLQRFRRRNKIWICLLKWFLCLGLIRTCSSQQPETFIMFTSSRVLPAHTHTHTPAGIDTNTPGWCHLKVSRSRRRWRDQQSSPVWRHFYSAKLCDARSLCAVLRSQAADCLDVVPQLAANFAAHRLLQGEQLLHCQHCECPDAAQQRTAHRYCLQHSTPNNHLPAFPGIRSVLCPPSCSWQVPGSVRIHLLSSVSIVQANGVHLPCCDLRVSWSTQNESKLHQVRVGGWSQTSARWCKLRGVAECVSWLRLCRAPPGGRVRAVRTLCFTTTTTLRLGLVFKITL